MAQLDVLLIGQIGPQIGAPSRQHRADLIIQLDPSFVDENAGQQRGHAFGDRVQLVIVVRVKPLL